MPDVRTLMYEFELARPLGDANNPLGRKRAAYLAVCLDTDEGAEGVSVAQSSSRELIHSLVEELLLGEDPRGGKGLCVWWGKMVDQVLRTGNPGLVTNALSALDVAMWETAVLSADAYLNWNA